MKELKLSNEVQALIDDGIDFDDDQYIDFIHTIKNNGFTYWSSGSFRYVYHRGNVVIKVPRNIDGLYDNISEHYMWHKYRNNPTTLGQHLAPCRLLPNGSLMMVETTMDYRKDIPQWCKEYIDSTQVGLYKGKFVAFDYGIDVPDRVCLEKKLKFKNSFFSRTYVKDRPYLQGKV